MPAKKDRTEEWDTTTPSGEKVHVWRNIETGEKKITPIKND